MKPHSVTWAVMGFLLWPSWDEIWTENENTGPRKPDSCITHSLTQRYMYVIVVVFPSLRAPLYSLNPLLSALSESLCVCRYVIVCRAFHHWVQICFGWVHYCMNECLPMINKGLHFPPLSSLHFAILSVVS